MNKPAFNLPKTPRSMDLAITAKCNLRCAYCSHFSSEGEVGDLPTEEWVAFFGELSRCAVLDVCLQGGEPFFRQDLPEIIEGVVRNKMRYSVLSNGVLIGDELAGFLASTKRCNFVQVSIDGSCQDVHDSFRGRGSFQRVVTAIQALRRHRVSVTVRVTIHKKNFTDLENIARFLLTEVGIPEFSLNSAADLGLCRQHAEEVQLTAEERAHVMKSALRLVKKYPGRIAASAGPLAEAELWRSMEERNGQEGPLHPQGGFLSGCNGTFTKLAVRADGMIVPCNLLPGIELGRINQVDLADVWLNHPELNRLRNRRALPLSDFAFCRGCAYIPYCTGNCPATADAMLGDPYHPSPEGCYRRFLEQGGSIPAE